jgi:hypothetical protein
MLNRVEIQALRNFVLRAGDGTRPLKGEETQNHVAVLQALQREEQNFIVHERAQAAREAAKLNEGAHERLGREKPPENVAASG